MNEKKIAKIAERVAFRYQDLGHGAGDIIWWVDNDGKVKTFKSTGKEYHHELSRLDMDLRWRGRIEPNTGRATMLPPLNIYQKDPDDIPLPGWLMNRLEKMGAKSMFIDTKYGMRRVARLSTKRVRDC